MSLADLKTYNHFELNCIKFLSEPGNSWIVKVKMDALGIVIYKQSVLEEDTWKEMKILHQLKHPNIVKLLGIVIEPDDVKMAGLILEYQSYVLYDVIHNEKISYSLNEAYAWIKQICQGLIYIHEQGMIHCDLKPKNVLLQGNISTIKLCDFGSVQYVDAEKKNWVGTYPYFAPEILEGTQYDQQVDVYSLGITIWEIIKRKMPFYPFFDKSKVGFRSYQKEQILGRKFFSYYLEIEIPELANLVRKCWLGPEARPIVKQILATINKLYDRDLTPPATNSASSSFLSRLFPQQSQSPEFTNISEDEEEPSNQMLLVAVGNSEVKGETFGNGIDEPIEVKMEGTAEEEEEIDVQTNESSGAQAGEEENAYEAMEEDSQALYEPGPSNRVQEGDGPVEEVPKQAVPIASEDQSGPLNVAGMGESKKPSKKLRSRASDAVKMGDTASDHIVFIPRTRRKFERFDVPGADEISEVHSQLFTEEQLQLVNLTLLGCPLHGQFVPYFSIYLRRTVLFKPYQIWKKNFLSIPIWVARDELLTSYREIKAHERSKAHPFVLRLLGFTGPSCKITDIDGLLLEYPEHGTLEHYVHTQHCEADYVKKCFRWAWQIITVVQYFHEEFKYIHRDIKPSNIFIFDNGMTAKLAGFSYTKKYHDCQVHTNKFCQLVPSVGEDKLAGEHFPFAYDFCCDIWSFGLLLYFLLYKVIPTDEVTAKGPGISNLPVREHEVNVDLLKLSQNCWQVWNEEGKRLTAVDIKKYLELTGINHIIS